MVTDAKQKLRRAVDAIFDTHPLFASIVARWKFQPTQKLPTFAVDGKHLFWNPQMVEKCTIAEIQWILLHEAAHIFLGHHLRAQGKDHKQFNISADLALNSIIRDEAPSETFRKQFLFPGEHPYSDLPMSQSAEWYYAKLSENQNQQQQPDKNKQGNPDSDSQSNQSGQGEGDPADKPGNTDRKAKPGRAGQSKKPVTAFSSEAESASQEKQFDQAAQNASFGDVLPADGTEAEAEQEWKEIVAQAVNAAKQCGNTPGWLLEKSEELLGKSETNWKAILRQFVTSYARSGHSYAKPNRRSSHRTDIVLPAHRSRNASKGCVLVDTSGSMGQSECNKALSEIQAVLESFPGSEVTLMQCDTRKIKDAERKFTRWDFPIRVPTAWLGRGGTDLNPAFQSISKRRSEFKWVIAVTDFIWDGTTTLNPGVPTMWISTTKATYHKKPNFGIFANLK